MAKNKKDVDLMWEIFDLINRKHCMNKLKIHRIYLYKKGGNKVLGFYRVLKDNSRSIGIYSELNKISKITTFTHELAHAYVDQILNIKYHKYLLKIIRRQPIYREQKEDIKQIMTHNKRFQETMISFIKTVDKNLKVELK